MSELNESKPKITITKNLETLKNKIEFRRDKLKQSFENQINTYSDNLIDQINDILENESDLLNSKTDFEIQKIVEYLIDQTSQFGSDKVNELNIENLFGCLNFSRCFYKKYNFNLKWIQKVSAHKYLVTKISELDNGDLLSVSDDGDIKLWDSNMECKKVLSLNASKKFTNFELDNSKTKMVILSKKEGMEICDTKSFRLTQLEREYSPIKSILVYENCLIFTRWFSNSIYEYSFDYNYSNWFIEGHDGVVTSLLYVNNNRFLSASYDKSIKVWNKNLKKCTCILVGHKDAVNCLVLFDTDLILSGSYDKTIKLWSLKTYECTKTFSGLETCAVDIQVSRNKDIISLSEDGVLKLWDYETGECMDNFRDNRNQISCFCLLSRTGGLVSGSVDGKIKIWTENKSLKECLNENREQVEVTERLKDNTHLLNSISDQSTQTPEYEPWNDLMCSIL